MTWIEASQTTREVPSVSKDVGDLISYSRVDWPVVGFYPPLLEAPRHLPEPPARGLPIIAIAAPELCVCSFAGSRPKAVRLGPFEGLVVYVVIRAADGTPKRPFLGPLAQLIGQLEVFKPVKWHCTGHVSS